MLAERCNDISYEFVSWPLSQLSINMPRNAVGVYINLRTSKEFKRVRAPKRGSRKYRRSKKTLKNIYNAFEEYRRTHPDLPGFGPENSFCFKF